MLTENVPLTYKDALVAACETFQGKPGTGDSLRAFDIGLKILNAKDEIDISEEEHKLLKMIIESNPAFMAVVVGRLLEFINVNK